MQEASFIATRRRLLFAGTAVPPALAGARTAAPSAVAEGPGGPLLAVVYTGQVDPALCLVSEKYDGVRAVWDGRDLSHRSGRPVAAPASFVKTLPRKPVDGELWLGRGRFDELLAIVRRREPREAEWAQLRYMLFELPGAGGSFAERAERLALIVARSASLQLRAAPQGRVANGAALRRRLDETVAGGGEGLMLHISRRRLYAAVAATC